MFSAPRTRDVLSERAPVEATTHTKKYHTFYGSTPRKRSGSLLSRCIFPHSRFLLSGTCPDRTPLAKSGEVDPPPVCFHRTESWRHLARVRYLRNSSNSCTAVPKGIWMFELKPRIGRTPSLFSPRIYVRVALGPSLMRLSPTPEYL